MTFVPSSEYILQDHADCDTYTHITTHSHITADIVSHNYCEQAAIVLTLSYVIFYLIYLTNVTQTERSFPPSQHQNYALYWMKFDVVFMSGANFET